MYANLVVMESARQLYDRLSGCFNSQLGSIERGNHKNMKTVITNWYNNTYLSFLLSLSLSLSSQAHVVSAFEQSLSNMTQRFHQLSATAERKDDEMTDLRQTIELLRKQSIQAGLTSAHMQSMGSCSSISTAAGAGVAGNPGAQKMTPNTNNSSPMHNHSSPGYAMGTPVRGIPQSSSTVGGGVDPMMNPGRHLSSDSMCSLNSISSGCSTQDKKKKKGWVSDPHDDEFKISI